MTQQTGIADTEPLWMGQNQVLQLLSIVGCRGRITCYWKSWELQVRIGVHGVGPRPFRHLSCQTPDSYRQLLLSVWFSEILQAPTFASEAIALSKYLFTVEYNTIFLLTKRHFSTWPPPPAPHWSCFFKLAFFPWVHYTPSVPWQSKFIYSVIKYHSHLTKVNSFFHNII